MRGWVKAPHLFILNTRSGMRVKAFSDIRINASYDRVEVTLGDLLFFSGLILWILQTYIIMSSYEDFFGGLFTKLVRWFCVFLFAVKLFLTEEKISVRLLTIGCLAGLLMLVSQKVGGGGMTLLQLLMLVLAARQISFRRICLVSFWTCLFAFACVIGGDLLGPLHKIPLTEWERFRHYLGFQYVSFGPILINNIVFCGLYAFTDKYPRISREELVRDRTFPWWGLVLLSLAEIWIYRKTDTSLSFVIGMLFIAAYIVVIKLQINVFADNVVVRTGAVAIFPVLCYGTYWICSHYKSASPLWQRIDEISHNRVRLTFTGIRKYGIHLFGHIVESNTDPEKGTYFYIDSGYMKNLLNYGIIFMILLLALYMMMSYAAVISQDLVLCIWMLCAALYSVFNNFMISPVENASLLGIWYAAGLIRENRSKPRWPRARAE